MSGIFGIFNRDGRPVDPARLETMRQSMAVHGRGTCDLRCNGSAGLGKLGRFDSQETKRPGHGNATLREMVVVAAGRVDNRDDLLGSLDLRPDLTAVDFPSSEHDDAAILSQAYLQWGASCPDRIYGDWSLAAWHPRQGRLFVARDHCGNTALYYYADERTFAFASSRQALLDLNLAPMKMDELYFAQVLLSWPAYHGERTIHVPIKRLPPAHSLVVTSDRLEVRQYWWLEHTPKLHLPRRSDYVEAFRELFDEAVRCRLRCDGDVAVTLSGGLDSGSVAVTAAKYLQKESKRLLAFTAVPMWATDPYLRNRFGDEWPFAQATAAHADNMELQAVTAATVSPIQAIRDLLAVHHEPAHAAGNFFWMQAIRAAARTSGCKVLLTGQMGNAGISWPGSPFSQSVPFQLRHFGWRRWPKEFVKRYAPGPFMQTCRNLRRSPDEWLKSFAIHPDLAERLNLLDRYRNDSMQHPRTPLAKRCQIIKPGRSLVGFRHAESGSAWGLEVRDPTADARVLAFTLSVPDHIFIDPKTGLDRWLIREAMKGILPDKVRTNRARGRQAADLVPRLRAFAEEVETALNELAKGPAAEYVNVPYMRSTWGMIETDDTYEAQHKAVTILTRGIMAGLWVNEFYNAT